MPISNNLAGVLEYSPYTDPRDWMGYSFVDFVLPQMVDVDASRFNDLLKTKLNQPYTLEQISTFTRDPGLKSLRKTRGHSETAEQLKAVKDLFDSQEVRYVQGVDPKVIKKLSTGDQQQTAAGNAYRLAYILEGKVTDFLRRSTELDPHLAELLHTVEHLVTTSTKQLAPQHPLPEFLEHQLSSLVKSVTCNSRYLRVTIPASAYGPASLSLRSLADRKSSMAIADLTQIHIEDDLWFSPSSPSIDKLWIGERIFWISLEQMLDDKHFHIITDLVQKHADSKPGDYVVKVGIRRPGFELPVHPLTEAGGAQALGHNLELRGHDSMGGYVTDPGSSEASYVFVTDLGVGQPKRTADKVLGLYEQAKYYYNQHNACTFTVPARSNNAPTDRVLFRRELNSLTGIGTFQEVWSRQKTTEYFDHYNDNIRTWITRRWYHDLNTLCGRGVIRELLDRFNIDTNIVEAGFGTGNMTKAIIEWVAQQRHLAQQVGYPQPGHTHLYGIDEASEMCDKANTRFAAHLGFCDFNQGDLLEYLRSHFANTKLAKAVHIVCGTLVLHDLLNQHIEERLRSVLETLRSVLSPDGIALFGDVFQPDSKTQWDLELEQWEERQKNEGMTPEQIGQFKTLNQEMINPVKQGDLCTMATQYGFNTSWIYLPHQHNEPSPFKICKLAKFQDPPATKVVPGVLL